VIAAMIADWRLSQRRPKRGDKSVKPENINESIARLKGTRS